MKTKLIIFTLLLFSVSFVQAQCENCPEDGIITALGNGIYSAAPAQAYYWEICSGNATIVGSNTGPTVEIDCGGSDDATLKVTRFVNGLCIPSCKECVCQNCYNLNNGCLAIEIEGPPEACESVYANILAYCMPECWDYVEWSVNILGTTYIVEAYNGPTMLFDLPPLGIFNNYIVVHATVYLENGEACSISNQELVECGPDGGGGHGKIINVDKPKDALYPNPVEKGGELYIAPEYIKGANSLTILDANGQIIKVLSSIDQSIMIESDWKSGIYFLSISKGQEVTKMKFVVK